MPMDPREFKKLLIDLDLSATEIAREVGISQWALTLYFRNVLKSAQRRSQIKRVLARRARKLGIPLPEFWTDSRAA